MRHLTFLRNGSSSFAIPGDSAMARRPEARRAGGLSDRRGSLTGTAAGWHSRLPGRDSRVAAAAATPGRSVTGRPAGQQPVGRDRRGRRRPRHWPH